MELRYILAVAAWLLALPASPSWACTYGTHVVGCDDSLTATSVAAINSKRAALINNAWGSGANGSLPTTQATVTTLSSDGTTGNPMNPNAPTSCVTGTASWDGTNDVSVPCPWWPMKTQRVDQFVTPMSNGQTQTMRFFFAASANNKHRFIVLNPGHSYTCYYEKDWKRYNMMPVTLGLLNAGYSVLQMVMPAGIGSTPPAGGWTDNPTNPCGSVANHNQLFSTYGDTAMHFFLEPLTQVINYLAAAPPSYFPDGIPFTDYNIAGLSGGGWTCSTYAAIDTRIRNAICIAGSTPGQVFADTLAQCGDNEQCSASFYTIAGWLDLYAMASQGPGRIHRQILNTNDHCCFGNTQWTSAPSTGFNYQTYYSIGGGGAAQCGNQNCPWATYINYYSGQITANLPLIAPAQNPPVIRDTQADTHTISTCSAATGGNAAFFGLTPCVGTSIDGGTTPQLDALSVIIATMDGNPPPPVVLAGGTRGLRVGGR
jgi:hypothetical protein